MCGGDFLPSKTMEVEIIEEQPEVKPTLFQRIKAFFVSLFG